MITLNRRALSNNYISYNQVKSNHEGSGNFHFLDFLELFRSGTSLFGLQQ